MTYVNEGQLQKANEALKGELRKSPDNLQIGLALADVAAIGKNYPSALAQYQQLVATHPGDALLRLRLGYTYQLTGDMDNAKLSFEKAAALAPREPAAVSALAGLLVSTGRLQEANDQYQRLLALAPDNPAVLNNVAFLLADTGGNLDDALQLAQKAVKKVPDNPHFSDTLGYVYLKKKMSDAAERIFSNLVAKDPRNATYHWHWATALLNKGDKARAKEELLKALEQKPTAATN